MRTIRRGVFETNSSTTHCATYTKTYKHIADIPLRDKKEFPTLNADGTLDVELFVYWDMEVRERDDIDLSSVKTIIEYLAAHAVFSCHETLWSRKNNEEIYHYNDNHANFVRDVQKAYQTVGLTAPTDVRPYFLDTGDNKIYITEDNINKWFFPFEEYPWFDKHSEWDKYVKDTIEKNPEAVNWPYAKHYIGMCGNDLCCSSYEHATDYYNDMSQGWDGSEEESDEDNITTNDMLTRQISLSFYHT